MIDLEFYKQYTLFDDRVSFDSSYLQPSSENSQIKTTILNARLQHELKKLSGYLDSDMKS